MICLQFKCIIDSICVKTSVWVKNDVVYVRRVWERKRERSTSFRSSLLSFRSRWIHSDNNDTECAAWRTDVWKVFLRVVNRISSSVMCFRSKVRSEAMRQVKWKARMKSPRHAQIHDRARFNRSELLSSARGISRISWKRPKWRYDFFELFSPRVAFRPSFMVMFEPPISPVRLCEKFFQVFIFYLSWRPWDCERRKVC